jgi:hypothetical protein
MFRIRNLRSVNDPEHQRLSSPKIYQITMHRLQLQLLLHHSRKIKPTTERRTDNAPLRNPAPGSMRSSNPKMKPKQKEKIQPALKLSSSLLTSDPLVFRHISVFNNLPAQEPHRSSRLDPSCQYVMHRKAGHNPHLAQRTLCAPAQ